MPRGVPVPLTEAELLLTMESSFIIFSLILFLSHPLPLITFSLILFYLIIVYYREIKEEIEKERRNQRRSRNSDGLRLALGQSRR